MSIKRILKKSFFAIIGLFTIAIAVILYLSKDDTKATPETIEAHLNSFYNKNKMGGFAVAVFTKDSLLYSGGFGYADVENERPYTTKTVQHIASISKTTIGVSLLIAQELGLLKLDDPINKHLPFTVINSKYPKQPITIKQLATHTSSMDYNERVVESLYINDTLKKKSLEAFMNDYFVNNAMGEVLFTDSAPGTQWGYSNIGAGLAAYIIEYKSGMTYNDFTAKYIFEPLTMNDTSWFESEVDSLQISSYYEPLEDGSIKKTKTDGVILYPARDLLTNVDDLTTYGQAILKGDNTILSNDSYRLMLEGILNSSVSNQETDNQAIFWMIDRNQYGVNYQLTGYNGGDFCINTMLWFDPKAELGYIFIGNTGQSQANTANHILTYKALASLGDYYRLNNKKSTFNQKAAHKWHNLYSRVRSLF